MQYNLIQPTSALNVPFITFVGKHSYSDSLPILSVPLMSVSLSISLIRGRKKERKVRKRDWEREKSYLQQRKEANNNRIEKHGAYAKSTLSYASPDLTP